MKVSKRTLALAIAALLAALPAPAQDRLPLPVRDGAQTRRPARQVDYEYENYGYDAYDSYYAQPEDAEEAEDEPSSPSDQPELMGDDLMSSHGGCGCCRSSCRSCCDAEPFKLFDSPFLDCWGINMGGWMAAGATWNPDSPDDRFNGPMVFNDRSNEPGLMQLYQYIDRPTDTGGDGWDLGGRVDFLYGTDYRFTTATGLEVRGDGRPKWNSHRFYGLAMPQLYMEVGFNDLKVKVGHFYTPIGYEVVNATGGFFYRHAYTHMYGEPFTHTGMLATYQWTDSIALSSGFTRGWDNWDGSGNPNLGYLGAVSWTGENSSLTYAHHWGNELTQSGAFASRYMQSIVWIHSFNDRLSHVFETDFGYQNDALLSGRDAKWYSMNSYWFYKVNESWTWGFVSEWFRDEGGYRVGGFLAPTVDGSLRGLSTARSGYNGTFYRVTFGPNWRPNGNPNLVIRPAVNFDWYEGRVDNPGGLRPFDDGSDGNQWTFGGDMIFTY